MLATSAVHCLAVSAVKIGHTAVDHQKVAKMLGLNTLVLAGESWLRTKSAWYANYLRTARRSAWFSALRFPGDYPPVFGDGGLNQCLERLGVELLALPDVDGSAGVAIEAGVE